MTRFSITDTGALIEALKKAQLQGQFDPGIDVTWFDIPIEIVIADVYFNPVETESLTFPYPLIGLVATLQGCLRELTHQSGIHTGYLQRDFYLYRAPVGSDTAALVVSSPAANRSVYMRMEEFTDAFFAFAREVRDLILTHAPFIQKHPDWDLWFGALDE